MSFSDDRTAKKSLTELCWAIDSSTLLFPENEQKNYQNIAENGSYKLEEVTSEKSEENRFGDSTVKAVARESARESTIGIIFRKIN